MPPKKQDFCGRGTSNKFAPLVRLQNGRRGDHVSEWLWSNAAARRAPTRGAVDGRLARAYRRLFQASASVSKGFTTSTPS